MNHVYIISGPAGVGKESDVEKRHIVNNNCRSIEQVIEMIISGERYIL